jgi:hypothetical protein
MEGPLKRPEARTWRHPAFAAVLAALALLVFTWPLARDPPLTLGETFVHLLGAWVAVVLALLRMSSALRTEADPGDGGRHE